MYRGCQIPQKLLKKLLFHNHTGVIKKVKHLEISRKLLPLAITILFNIKKIKKNKNGAKL